jgi:hypothetical protein
LPFYFKPKGLPPSLEAEKRVRAQLLGIEEISMQNTAQQQLTPEDAEKMRELLLRYDHANSNKPVDLNKVVVPYEFRQFPMVVYNHTKSKPGFHVLKNNGNGEFIEFTGAQYATRTVRSQKELDQALKEGFVTDPPVFDDPEEPQMPQTKNVTAAQVRRPRSEALSRKHSE